MERYIKFILTVILMIFLFSFQCWGKTLRIVSANLLYSNPKSGLAAQKMVDLNPDIIVVLEYTQNNIDTDLLLQNNYKFVVEKARRDAGGIAILCKNEYKAEGEIIERPFKDIPCFPFATISLTVNDKKMTLIGVHTLPPVTKVNITTDAIKGIQSWIQDGKLAKSIGSGQKGDLVVLAGDFNWFASSPLMKNFQKQGLLDSTKKSSQFNNATWGFSFLTRLFRIDCIYISKYISFNNSKTVKIIGSDHLGVMTDLQF